MFYDWSEYVMSVLGTTKRSSCSVLTLGNKIILYWFVLLVTGLDLSVMSLSPTGSPQLERDYFKRHFSATVRSKSTVISRRNYYSRHSPPPPPASTHTSPPPPPPVPYTPPQAPTFTPSYAGSKTVTDLWNRRVGAERLQQLTGCDVGQHQRLGHLDNGVHVGRQMTQHLLRLVQLPHCCFDLMITMMMMITMMIIIIMMMIIMVHFYMAYRVMALYFFQTSVIDIYWAIQAGLLNPLTFARHRLSPLAAFTSGPYFLRNGRRWQWICEF